MTSFPCTTCMRFNSFCWSFFFLFIVILYQNSYYLDNLFQLSFVVILYHSSY
jgi:hypothetical protein